jgi:quinol monooxygenase YgiN
MSEPIVFISHFRVKEGRLDSLRQLADAIFPRMESDKPRTLLFRAYVSEEGDRMSFLHVFADTDAMDSHFEGADERSRVAYESIVPEGWEIYGTPSQAALEGMRAEAAAAGVSLRYEPGSMGGFMRLA